MTCSFELSNALLSNQVWKYEVFKLMTCSFELSNALLSVDLSMLTSATVNLTMMINSLVFMICSSSSLSFQEIFFRGILQF